MFNSIKEIEDAVTSGKKVYWKDTDHIVISYTPANGNSFIIVKEVNSTSNLNTFKLLNNGILNGEIWEYFSEDDTKYMKKNKLHLTDLQYPIIEKEVAFLRNKWKEANKIPLNVSIQIPLSYLDKK